MKLFLFDIDGTLIRSHGVGRTAMGRAIAEVTGLADPLGGISFGGKTDPGILEEVYRQSGLELDGAGDTIFTRYLELLKEGLEVATKFTVLPGVRPLLDRLVGAQGVGLALGTGNIEPGARLKLDRAGLNSYFPTGGFGSDAGDRTELLRAGLRKARAHYRVRFDDVWVIGDTPRDIEAARGAGFHVVAVATGGYGYDSLAELAPDALFEDLSDLQAACRVLMNTA